MSRCTALVQGHRTQSGRDACPSSSRRGYNSYSSYSFYSNTYGSSYSSGSSSGGRISGTSKTSSARWSRPGSLIFYTSSEIQEIKNRTSYDGSNKLMNIIKSQLSRKLTAVMAVM